MYKDTIKEATGCDDTEAEHIEEFMRNIIFCSPLDSKTRDELREAARTAQLVLTLFPELSEEPA